MRSNLSRIRNFGMENPWLALKEELEIISNQATDDIPSVNELRSLADKLKNAERRAVEVALLLALEAEAEAELQDDESQDETAFSEPVVDEPISGEAVAKDAESADNHSGSLELDSNLNQDALQAEENANRDLSSEKAEMESTGIEEEKHQPSAAVESADSSTTTQSKAEKEEPASPNSFQDSLEAQNDNSLASRLQKSPISDLKSVIGLNKRFLFANELFDGNMEAFNRALNELNHINSHDEALRFIDLQVKARFNWNDEEDVTQQFLELVERRFL